MSKNFFAKLNLNWRAYLAEFFGTFVFVFVASCAVVSDKLYTNVGLVGIALATGLALSAGIFATVHISGGHLNPAVTLALWFVQKINTANAALYIISQVFGSFAAAFLVFLIFGAKSMEFFLGGPTLGVDVSVQTAMVLEAIFTAILTFVVFATAVDRRGSGSFAPLTIGFFVVVASIAIGNVTGAALNPARAIGPLVLSKVVDFRLLVYIIGPLAGSVFGIVYDLVFLKSKK
ncbi:MAG TPA: aquaporin [Candidatus Saccharimonadales bacterium]|nr:aquaporin [Candidatus Saccharimonadales bacterium]